MSPEIFQHVRAERTSAQIVEQVKQAIHSGKLQIGDRLPSEREMAEQLNVSRVTVRDALRILEARGLIAIRVGARGGAFVTVPMGSVVSEGLTDMLALSDLSAQEVTETRRVLEVGAVPLVCERATEDDFTELEQLCAEADQAVAEGQYDMVMSAQFHLRLARATHNQAYVMLMEVLQDSMLASLRKAREAAPQMGIRGVEEHKQIVAAMREGDVTQARCIMSEHLERTATRLIDASSAAEDSTAQEDGAGPLAEPS